LTEEILAVEEACVRGEMYGIAGDYDSESGYEIHRLKELKPIPFTRWGILVGDVVHQARAALDNLVELLNIRETGHPLRKTEFPICSTKTAYLKGFKKAGNVGTKALALIESFQPYHRGDAYVSDPFWILHGLWNMDKHRNTAIVASLGQTVSVTPKFRATAGTVTVGRQEIVYPEFFPHEDGTEIGRFRIERSSTTEVYMEHALTLHIKLGDGQPGAGGYVTTTLRECVGHAAESLSKFEEFF
jgi:hypothetical protein